jgi:hypothetical protein
VYDRLPEAARKYPMQFFPLGVQPGIPRHHDRSGREIGIAIVASFPSSDDRAFKELNFLN